MVLNSASHSLALCPPTYCRSPHLHIWGCPLGNLSATEYWDTPLSSWDQEMGVSGGLVGYLQGKEDPNSNPGKGCTCTHTVGVHPVEASGASCSWKGAHSWGLILMAFPKMYNRMDPKVAGPPNHRSGSPVGLTSCRAC